MTSSDMRERGGGAVGAPMAIATLAVLAAIGLGVDGVRAAQGVATADGIAQEAARAAGQALDPDELRRGIAMVDPDAAVAAARTYLSSAGAEGNVTVLGEGRIRVEARITRPTVLLGLLGRSEITSSGTAEAELIAIPPDGGPP